MKNNSMIEYKENFISKIKKFFKNLFKNTNEEEIQKFEISNIMGIDENSEKTENEFFENIKVDSSNINKYIDKNKFLDYIDGNVEALNMLSIDRLRKLNKYYDEVIEENEKIIKKLKKEN